jgi:2-dehydro-3-deoxygluconokinase
VTLGETMVVMVPQRRGSLDSVDLFKKDFGGAESNVAIGLARLGHRAAWISSLGDDPFGRYIYGRLRAEGVEVSQVNIDPHHPTGLYIKEFSDGSDGIGTKVYYFRSDSAASHLVIDDQVLFKYSAARYLFVTGITPALGVESHEIVLKVIAQARQLGMKIVFDPNLRLKLWNIEEARNTLDVVARLADIVLSGLGEAQLLTGASSAQQAARAYLDRGAEIVVIKLEARGAYFETESERGTVPAFTVDAVDEIGAGDAFDAGLLSGLLDGLALPGAVERGCALGALVVTVPSDHAALPNRQDLQRFMATAGRSSDVCNL